MRTEQCPDDVFVLPITASFKINDNVYEGTQVHLDHVEQVDPLFTMRANWHLQPKVNLSHLMQDPLALDKPIRENNDASLVDHPMTWTTVSS
jgi:hypothetical protein